MTLELNGYLKVFTRFRLNNIRAIFDRDVNGKNDANVFAARAHSTSDRPQQRRLGKSFQHKLADRVPPAAPSSRPQIAGRERFGSVNGGATSSSGVNWPLSGSNAKTSPVSNL